jgi:hypothetical protein
MAGCLIGQICLEPLPDQEPLALLGAEIELLASLDLSADNTAEKQRGRPFDPGQSGNPWASRVSKTH